jgi:hypothetical protein
MMTRSAPTKPQGKKFIEKARELGCDEHEAAFDERLAKIAKATTPALIKKPAQKKKPRQTGGAGRGF